ncbi:hypothetical protein C8A03DRAFT_19909 [Achaetomium macrosporum]|uniref:RlpA-like protein double-psi beta-barrel domain-containing protein n=1 Tax=Achaetomium macrosporum TaxID=79813 RepID=A0AAN7H5Z3_9PEZI|nr:hypothetical protein C8A03DRAFT_19909 [Achaetomium macrosporum]
MFTKMLTTIFVITAAFTVLTFASPAPKMAGTDNNMAITPIVARDTDIAAASGKFTYYNLGPGACGTFHGDGDYVVALSHADFDPSTPNGNPNNNPLCGKRLRASYNGKNVDVTVADRCVSCNSGDLRFRHLDLNPAAFGVIQGTWQYI